jgi:dihydrofolate reductase
MREYARIWQAVETIVYSTTLEAPPGTRTRIERTFDPAAIARMKSEAQKDISIGGAGLAAQAIHAGLVDEFRQVVAPIIVGGGKPWLPEGRRIDLRLIDERRFAGGAVYHAYAKR